MTVEDSSLPGRLLRVPNYYIDKVSTLDYCQFIETKDGELLVKFDRLRDALDFHLIVKDAQFADYTEIFNHLTPSIIQYNPRLINFGFVRIDEPNKFPIRGIVRYQSQIFGSGDTRRQFLEFEDIDDAVFFVSLSPLELSLEIPSQLERELLFSNSGNLFCAAEGANSSRFYKIELYRVEQGFDQRTTCMIRNIPNKYTQTMLIEWLNETHKGKYDFLYLRMDFRNRCNVGYAFINFIDYRYSLMLSL